MTNVNTSNRELYYTNLPDRPEQQWLQDAEMYGEPLSQEPPLEYYYDDAPPEFAGTTPTDQTITDDPNRGYIEGMQNLDGTSSIFSAVEQERAEQLPDLIFLDGWPQLPKDQWYGPIRWIVGRCEGPIRNLEDISFTPTDAEVQFGRPESTHFVRCTLEDGQDIMMRYDPTLHGPWENIPDTGLTPTMLLEQLYGFGDSEVDEGNQFQRVRKTPGGASNKHWSPRWHPKIRVHALFS